MHRIFSSIFPSLSSFRQEDVWVVMNRLKESFFLCWILSLCKYIHKYLFTFDFPIMTMFLVGFWYFAVYRLDWIQLKYICLGNYRYTNNAGEKKWKSLNDILAVALVVGVVVVVIICKCDRNWKSKKKKTHLQKN